MSWLLVFYYFFSTEVSVESEVRITLLEEEHHGGKTEPKHLMTREFFGEEFKRIEAEENEKRR
jgi:hypothetical protein